MLSHSVLPDSALVAFELEQAADEGKDASAFAAQAGEIQAMPHGPEKERAAVALLEAIDTAPGCATMALQEPSDLLGILSSRPNRGRVGFPAFDGEAEAAYPDRVLGAWLGRCAGCLLGIPVERWARRKLVGFLHHTGNWPISRYLSSDVGEELRSRYGVSDVGWSYGRSRVNWINNVPHMVEDDDINYMLVALRVLERHGALFGAEDVAEAWLTDLPILHTFTAERIAYRNVANGIFPPHSALWRNPCREWIGAQIRADVYGYVSPGDPAGAAAMAWRDASVSHTRSGIYGGLFVAGMLAAAAVTSHMPTIIDAGLSQLPAQSRYAQGIGSVLAWKADGVRWEEAIDRLHERFDETDDHQWCHAIPNGMAVCIGLLYGELDLGRTIGTAVAASFDKDCNGATAGSVVGMAVGAAALDERWTGPLGDTLEAGIPGLGLLSIRDLARRTVALCSRLRERAGGQ